MCIRDRLETQTAALGSSKKAERAEDASSEGEEKTPPRKEKEKRPSARIRTRLTGIYGDVGDISDSGSPEAAAVEEEPHVAGTVAPSPESDRKSPVCENLESRSPSRRPVSRAMRAAAAARARLAARNSWQRVFDPDAGAPAGGKNVHKVAAR